jgi:FtsP/CotA-like multicopper oxidase with cupredoxin domain
VKCGETRRLRFINMSSHARFYVWFHDDRNFQVIELDGVTYKPKQTNMIELASGQRVSILVNTNSPSGQCEPARIIAASDPKVGRGTKRCPMLYMDPTKGFQLASGFLDVVTPTGVKSVTPLDAKALDVIDLDKGQGGDVNRFKVWGEDKVTCPGSSDSNAHAYPSSGCEVTPHVFCRNRLKLKYKALYSDNRKDLDGLKNYGYSQSPLNDRELLNPVALAGFHDFELEPAQTAAPWTPPRPTRPDSSANIHYIKLDRQLKDGVGNGLAAMAEVPVAAAAWAAFSPPEPKDPNEQEKDKRKNPKFPSLFRALEKGVLAAPSSFTPDGGDSGGRTIILPDTNQKPHWFVIRSSLGDHPMHLHGHEFVSLPSSLYLTCADSKQQLLAILPIYWGDTDKASVQQLYDQVVSNTESTKGYPTANPMRRDTIWIEKDLVYVIAIKPDNPGVWYVSPATYLYRARREPLSTGSPDTCSF